MHCGWNHSAALSHSGELYVFGDNSHGQCGISDSKQFNKQKRSKIWVPQLIDREAFGIAPIREVSLGAHHSVLVDAANSVFGYGLNNNGQLVFTSSDDSFSQQFMDFPIRMEIDEMLAVTDYQLTVQAGRDCTILRVSSRLINEPSIENSKEM